MGFMSPVAMFTIYLRKPYVNSNSTSITETVTINNMTNYYSYFEAGGRTFDFRY